MCLESYLEGGKTNVCLLHNDASINSLLYRIHGCHSIDLTICHNQVA